MFDFFGGRSLAASFEEKRKKNRPNNAVPVDELNTDTPMALRPQMRDVRQAYNAQGQQIPTTAQQNPQVQQGLSPEAQALISKQNVAKGIVSNVEQKKMADSDIRKEVEDTPITNKAGLKLKTNAMSVANNNIKADDQIINGVKQMNVGSAATTGRTPFADVPRGVLMESPMTSGDRSGTRQRPYYPGSDTPPQIQQPKGVLSDVMTTDVAGKALTNQVGQELFGNKNVDTFLTTNKNVKPEVANKVKEAVTAAPEGQKNAAGNVAIGEENKKEWDNRPLPKTEAIRSLTKDKSFFGGIQEAINDPSFARNLMKFGITTMAAASVPGANTFGAVAAGLQAGLQDYIEQPDKKNSVKLFDKFVETGIFTPGDYDTIMNSEDKQKAVYELITKRMEQKAETDTDTANKAAEAEQIRKLEFEEYKHQNAIELETAKTNLKNKFPKEGDTDANGNIIGPAAASFETAQSRMGMYDSASTSLNKLLELDPEDIDARAGVVDDFLQGTMGLPLSQKGADIEQITKDLRTKLQLMGKEMMGPGMGAMTNAEWDILEGVISNLSFKQSPEQFRSQLLKAAGTIQDAKNRLNTQLTSFTKDPANASLLQDYGFQGVTAGSQVPIRQNNDMPGTW